MATAGERIAVLEIRMTGLEKAVDSLAKEVRAFLKSNGWKSPGKMIAIRTQQVALIGSIIALTLKVLEVF